MAWVVGVAQAEGPSSAPAGERGGGAPRDYAPPVPRSTVCSAARASASYQERALRRGGIHLLRQRAKRHATRVQRRDNL